MCCSTEDSLPPSPQGHALAQRHARAGRAAQRSPGATPDGTSRSAPQPRATRRTAKSSALPWETGMPAAVMYKGRGERPRRTGTAWVAVPTRRSAGIGATPVDGITLSDGEDQGERAPSRRYERRARSVGCHRSPSPTGRSVRRHAQARRPTLPRSVCRIHAWSCGRSHGYSRQRR